MIARAPLPPLRAAGVVALLCSSQPGVEHHTSAGILAPCLKLTNRAPCPFIHMHRCIESPSLRRREGSAVARGLVQIGRGDRPLRERSEELRASSANAATATATASSCGCGHCDHAHTRRVAPWPSCPRTRTSICTHVHRAKPVLNQIRTSKNTLYLCIQSNPRGEPGSAVEQLVRVYDSLHYPGAVKWANGAHARGWVSILSHTALFPCIPLADPR